MPDIIPISVKQLQKSTAILPRAQQGFSGYFTGMEPVALLAWIDERKIALGIRSDLALEKRAGAPSAVQNLRKTAKKGHGSVPKAETMKKLVDVLGELPASLSVRFPTVTSDRESIVAELRKKQAELQRQIDAIDVTISLLDQRQAG